MIGAHSPERVRAAEQPAIEAGLGAVLMSRAAFGLAGGVLEVLRSRQRSVRRRGARGIRRPVRAVYGARVVGLIGPGNNGGDGLWALSFLARRGVAATAVLLAPRAHAEALAAARRAGVQVFRLSATAPAGPSAGSVTAAGLSADAATSAGPSAGSVTSADLSAGAATPADPAAGAAASETSSPAAGAGAPEAHDVDSSPQALGLGAAVRMALKSDVLIDAILGTGARGALRSPAAELVSALAEALESAQAPAVVACDLPSGINPATGQVQPPALRAGLTVSFGAAKTGLLLGAGEEYCGRLRVIPIGIEDRLPVPELLRLQSSDVKALLPRPGRNSHKYSRGVVGVIAGSAQFPGAAVLACRAAVAAGAGMVRYLGPAEVAHEVRLAVPEAVWHRGDVDHAHVDAWVLGSGVGEDPEQRNRIRQALTTKLPAVVDAAALDELPALQPGPRPSLLRPELVATPHAGELARLLARLPGEQLAREQIEQNPLAAAQRAADGFGVTLLLKGHTTVISSPVSGSPVSDSTAELYSQAEGSAWLGTAGSGDVLAGLLGALLAQSAGQGSSPARIAALAASVHGRAGRIAATGADSGAEDDPSERLAATGTASGAHDERSGRTPGHPIRAGDIVAALPRLWL